MFKILISNLKRSGKWESAWLLSAMTLCCIGISLTRMIYTGTSTFFFLNWNIFLAFVPWILSTLMVAFNFPSGKWGRGFAIALWLLFFPNCAYVFTDMFHLYEDNTMPYWFDFAMILFYAFTSLLYGLFSLMDIETLLAGFVKYPYRVAIVIIIGFLAAFGVYLGRFLRWNSWDIVSNPGGLMSDLADRIVHPAAHKRTWTFTLLFGLFLNFAFFSFGQLRKVRP